MDYSHNYLGKIVAITTGSKDVNEGNINGIFPFFTCSRNHTFSNSYSFDDEALLISGNGDVGNVKYYKGKFEAYQRTYVLTNSILDFKYLYYYLENGLVKYLSSEQSGTTIQFIKLGQLKNFPIAFPYQLEQQKKIAEILTKVDEAIENTEQLIQKYEQVKVGLMQDLLTKGIDENGNIRSEETHQFKDSPLGRIPVEWEVKSLGDYIEAIDPQPDHRTPAEVLNGVPYIGISDVNTEGKIDFINSRKVGINVYNKQNKSFKI
ncbi:restriction endonuclease subunit S, partial [Empedobacter sp.]|uniref:restriction endonuclease subunit S n=1 Tax=Empedobacter sp. TaxID=1927715 RepID=UPI0028AEE4CD